MAIHNKTPEEFYAQTAAFDAEHSHPYVAGRRVGKIATTLLAGESFRHTFNLVDRDRQQELTPGQYVDFLRNADPETRADIGFLAGKMQDYARFSEAIDHGLRGASEESEHYLGSGSNGSAYRLKQDGEDFAVKTGGVSYRDIRIFRLGSQVKEPYRDRLAHLEAIDLDKRTSVMNLIPGERIQSKTFEERDAIPRNHIKDAIDTVLAMDEAGITVDPKASNFLYDKGEGFGFVDYMPIANRDKYTSAVAVMELEHMLTAGLQKHPGQVPHAENVRIINKFLDVLEEDYPELLKQAAEYQTMTKADPDAISEGVYDIYSLPSSEEFDEFKARVLRLGLDGTPPYVTQPVPEKPADVVGDDQVW